MTFTAVPATERFAAKVAPPDPETGCIEWTAARNPHGYGTFYDRRTVLAHRWAYEQARGPIPARLVLDHLCRNRACVNVEHLEVVTHRANILRGVGMAARNATKELCPEGHEYEYRRIDSKKRGQLTERWCRPCRTVYRRTLVERAFHTSSDPMRKVADD